MKVINKILCFLSVLVLCVPLFCFPVSAGSGVGNVLQQTDLGTPIGSINDTDSLSSYIKNHHDELNEDYGGSRLIQFGDYWYQFTQEEIIDSSYIFACKTTNSTLLSSDNIYYISFTSGRGLSSSESSNEYSQLILFSTSPIYLIPSSEDSNSFVFSSDSPLYFSRYLLGWQSKYNTSFYYYFANINGRDARSHIPISYSSGTSDLKTFNYRPQSNNAYEEVSYERMQCNFNLDTTVLPNVTPQKFDKLSVNGQESPLSDYIDVKLTPEFCLDMDRVFDKNTGQNDYFKLEVTNNSDSNIQFYCAIVDPGVKTLYNDNGQVSEFAFNHSYWNYIHDSEYYQLDAKTESRYLGFASTTTLYANKLAGNIFWIILKPDEHFEDYIYWENVKIKPTTSYDFLCEACPTENDIATDMFVTSNEQLEKQFYLSGGSKAHFWSISESLEVDQSVEQYALHSEDVCEIYRVNFSVLSIPEFSSTVRGGNSKITSGWSDTQKQASNPYYKQNLMTGQIEGIENYKEFKGNLSDVNVNLDDVGIDDVKSYISYSQSFFGLLKSVFQCFPALWIIIVFGLTAIVVIAIVRYIRG